MDFRSYFELVHGRAPFPWQSRLATMVEGGGWPDALHLPTSAGKTALVDVWLWARAQGWPHVPRRLYYLIDRRQLVDAAAAYAANSIARAGLDVAVVRLRGGVAATEDEWMLDPSRPAMVSTTVDQLGSRLLGRAYGVGRYSAAIHAGLAGNDALIVIDEAHLVEPLRQTLDRVAALRQAASASLGLPWHVITMTATPVVGGRVLGLDEADLQHPLLSARFGARKLTALHSAAESPADSFAAQAVALQDGGAPVVGVIVNRVALAREIHSLLAQRGTALLLMGRTRPFERDALGAELLQGCGTQSRTAGQRQPLFVVATQTIEVGLDLDFDALVTELAPVSALRQRFGRLDRLGAVGTTHAAVIATAGSPLPYSQAALDNALKWLKQGLTAVKGVGKVVDLGVSAVAAMPAPPVESTLRAPWLMQPDLDLLFDVELPLDVAPYLHGEVRRADLGVAWRADLDDLNPADWPDLVERQLPVTEETMPLPVRAARQWLAGLPADAADLDTEPDEPEDKASKRGPRVKGAAQRERTTTFVLWDGESARLSTNVQELRPGMLVVLPSSAGGYDRYGWAPQSTEPVSDLMASGAVAPRRWRGDNTRTQYAVALAPHMKGVGAIAEKLAAACGLNAGLVRMLGEAGRLHDLGKNDPRFQLLLGARAGELLAKSGAIDPRITREFAGLARGWRHEVGSVAARPAMEPVVRYLVGSHHGRGKPWLPAAPDLELWRQARGADWPDLHRDMVREYGWWGLALLEALLRLADWARSVQEQDEAASGIAQVAA